MMLDMKVTDFIDKLSSADPVPGGGGASATAGAMGAALGMMVANLTIGKKKYADVEEEIVQIKKEVYELQQRLLDLTDEDARAFEPLAKAYGLPRETEAEKQEKEKIMEDALNVACQPPIQIMEVILQIMQFMKVLGEKGSSMAISDVGVGILFLQAALEGASLNVFINTKSMKNRSVAKELDRKTNSMIQDGAKLKAEVYEKVLNRMT